MLGMKTETRKRLRIHLLIVLAALGLHYLMILLAAAFLSGDSSWQGMGYFLRERLTTPGDAWRYLDIAQNGYVREGENAINLVFYPLYPLLIRLLSAVTGNPGAAGIIISQASYAGASVLLYELIRLDGDDRSAWDGVLLMALYPFSMFAMGVFTEGLFLLLTIGCLYAIRRQKFLWAGVIGFFAALTRTQGMLLVFPAVYEIVSLSLGKEARRCKGTDAAVLLIPAGFGVYLGINYALHGNAFQFLLYEADTPWYQTAQWIGPNIATQYAMALEHEGLAMIIYWVQIALYFSALGVLIFGLWKKERIGYLLYGGVYLGFTYLSGWMISGGRYMFGCVPIFIVLAKLRDGVGKRLLLLAAGMLFFAYSLFYLMGYSIM